MAHAWNPSYLGGWNQEDQSLRPAWANSSLDPHLQNNQSKMEWKYGSSSRATCFAQSSEFKAQFNQKKFFTSYLWDFEQVTSTLNTSVSSLEWW
jgi:hypothetical protein